MKPPVFSFERPTTIDEALTLLGESEGEAQVLAGGQSLIPLLNLRVVAPELIIDLSRLSELKQAGCDQDVMFIGAGVTHSAIEDGCIPDPSHGLMRAVAAHIANRTVRHRGTIGGSVAMADPAADWPSCLMALDATVVIADRHTDRRVGMADFIHDVYTTDLECTELILGFDVPILGKHTRWGRAKMSRKSGSFADSIAVVTRDPDAGWSRVVLTGADTRPRSLPLTERWVSEFHGQVVPEQELCRHIAADIADLQVDDPYLRRCHRAVVQRAVLQAFK